MSLGTRCLVGLVALVMVFGVDALAADYPNCRWNCRSNDVELEGVYLDESSICTPGQTVHETLYGVFINGTGTDRHDVALIADLVITTISGTATTRLNVTNLTSLIPPGTSDLPIAEISFPCEASIELRGIIVSWDTKAGGDLTCPSRASKCTYTAQVIVRAAPLVVDFASSAPVCQGTSVSFVSKTSGGTPPYSSYLWDFGDGVGSSTNVNPSYTYSLAGTYTVSLTVVDEGNTSTTSHSVVIYALLPATASNGGPYCNDDAIELYVSEGANYAWAGPSEFTSTERNPVVSGGTPGIYTVTVTSSFGCSSTASTQVVVDSSPPVLTIPADQTVECGLDFSPSTTGSASASDVTGAPVTVSYSDVFTADECGDGTGSIERTWIAASSCGNTTHAIQTITIVDTTAPSLTISSTTLECDGSGNADDIEAWLLSAIATDACGSVSVSHDYAGLTATCSGVGEAIVTFIVADLCGNSAQRTSTLRVLDTTSPVAEADLATVEAGASILIDVTGNDSDVCSAELTLISVGNPVKGSAVLLGGEVEYTAPAAAGADSFTYIIEDCSGLRGTGQVTITVLASNNPPSANDAVVAAQEDALVDIVLTASDPDGDVLTYAVLTGLTHGTITRFNGATGELIYSPSLNYYGEDSFTFEVCDPEGLCDSATVTITVESRDDLPIPNPQLVTTPEDTALGIQLTGSDVDGDVLTYGIVSEPSHGTITGFDVATGALIYIPSQHYAGVDSFVFEIYDTHDDHGSPQATVTITVVPVNDGPVASDQTRATSEDTPTEFFALAIADPDNTLAEMERIPVELPLHGSLEQGPDRTVKYTPEPGYSGEDTFTYMVCDPAGLCDTATVTVTISATNENPELSALDQTTPEDTPIDIPVTHWDPDGDMLTCSASTPSHGTVSPQQGTVSGLYRDTETLTYTPERDFVGIDQIVVQCDDGNGGSASVTIEITVTAVNDRPQANDGYVTMSEDTSASITVTGSDIDGDTLSYAVVGAPNHGEISDFDPATGQFVYTPTRDYNGTDEIIFQVCDPSNACATGVVTIAIEPTDDNPIPDPQTVTTHEDVARHIVLTAIDPDGDVLTYGIVSGPSHGTITGFDTETGALTYVPDDNYVGTDSFVFEARDLHAEHGGPQATVTITVTPVNDPPIANDQVKTTLEERAVDIALTGTDVDGNALTFRIDDPPGFGLISDFYPATGELTYTPDVLFSGEDEFTFSVCDSEGVCASATVKIVVVPSNDPPSANDAVVAAQEDALVDIVLTASDPDGDVLTYAVLTGLTHGTITRFNGATGELIYSPSLNYYGEDSFTFEVCDPEGLCDSATVTITVESRDDLPIPNPQLVTTPEDTALGIQLTGSDVDGDVLTYGIVSEPSHGTITGFDVATGALIYIPSQHYAGVDSFVFEIYDTHDDHGSPQATVTITVVPVNDGPVASDQTRATSEDTPTEFFALAIADPDNTLAEMERIPVELPLHGSLEQGPDRTVKYTPEPGYSGEDTFTYMVCDPAGLCDTATVTVTISATNENPELSALDQTTPEDTPIDIPVTHWDPDGDMLTCSASTPSHGTVSPQQGTVSGLYRDTETLTYTPERDFVGIDQIVVQCDDGNGGSASVTIEITVTAVNDRPQANDGYVTMSEDTSASITVTGSDIDGDTLSYAVVGAPNHGEISDFDPATGQFVYTPTRDYNGTDEIIFQVCDPSNACATGVVTIAIEPTDDNPIPDPQTVTTHEDVARHIVLTAIDPDGDVLTYGIVSGPSHGTITGFDTETGALTYVPDDNYVGTDSFVFEARDLHAEHGGPQATVTITVTPVNDIPSTENAIEVTWEDTRLVATLPGSDIDDSDLVFTLLSDPSFGTITRFDSMTGRYTYIPASNYSGVDVFAYEICDPSGACVQGTVQIHIAPINDEPVAQSDRVATLQDTPIEIALSATDVEDSSLTYKVALPPRNGTLTGLDSATGSVQYKPNLGYVGDDSFLFRVCDADGACDTALVSIAVIDVNDAPRATYQETTINQGQRTLLAARATDPDGEPLTFSIVFEPLYGTIEGFDPVSGAFTYVSINDYVGPDLIRFEACDVSGACDVGMIQLSVVPPGGGGTAIEICPRVVISEIAWAGTKAGETDEWIELRNLELIPVDLDGWTLRWRSKTATLPEDLAWRIVSLSGVLAPLTVDVPLQFEPNALSLNTWWVTWSETSTFDHLLIERDADDTVLHRDADVVYPLENEFGLSMQLPDEGAVLELLGSPGCLVDAVNIGGLPGIKWPAGATVPPASMERTDLFVGDDLITNWHTNLGLVRVGFDAHGNLLRGTPKVTNSPILDLAVQRFAFDVSSYPVGVPIVILFGDDAIYPADPQLWNVVVTSGNGDVQPAAWDVGKVEGGDTNVTVFTNLLQFDVRLHLWIRTPTGDVLFAPILVYPY